jgi:hypothetical protein
VGGNEKQGKKSVCVVKVYTMMLTLVIVDAIEVDIDFGTFLTILTRPDGFKPAGSSQEFIQGFQVFDKEGDGYISAGELRYGKQLFAWLCIVLTFPIASLVCNIQC